MLDAAGANDNLSRFDWGTIRQALRAGRAPSAWLARWLPLTYAEPKAFRDALYRQWSGSSREAGTPTGFVDLYQDCVSTHLGRQRAAMTCQEGGKKKTLTFDELHARAGARMAAWRAQGIKAGANLCIVASLGPEFLVALMAALRMGLVVSIIPPVGTSFVQNRLAALKPDCVVLQGGTLDRLDTDGYLILSSTGTDASGPLRPHRYAVKDPVLRTLCPFGENPLEVVEVQAGDLHAALIRDALFVFALEEKDILSMPGFDPLVCQPPALLAALIAGAAWAELSPEDVASDRRVLDQHGVTVLGVAPAVRSAITAGEGWPSRGIRTWFRSMTDRLDLELWDELSARSVRAGVPSFNAAFCTSLGGAVLFGPVIHERLDLQAWPVPGLSWQMAEIAAGALPALHETGILTPLVEQEPVVGVPRLLLAKRGDGYCCVGSVDSGPDAHVYPIDEVSAIVERIPGVKKASAVVTRGTTMNDAHIAILAFVAARSAHDERADRLVTPADIREVLLREMGPGFAPSSVEVLSLRPRRTPKGDLDRTWCRSQYLGGALAAKARDDLFAKIARLGDLGDSL